MSILDSRERALLGLALLFHDPPWKPWAIMNHISYTKGRDGLEKILSVIKANLGGDEEGWNGEVLGLYGEIEKRFRLEGLRAHERQAVLIPLAIAAWLKLKNREDLADLFYTVAGELAGHKYADVDMAASSLDRLELQKSLRKLGGNLEKMIYTDKVRIVNPFIPNEERGVLKAPNYIEAWKIVNFLEEYSRLVADALVYICREEGGEECYMKALHTAYLLLEPSWYYFTESSIGTGKPEIYVPPADTRIPTHTVFDHVNTALTVMLLRDNGCLAVIDLAGVQSWIMESRRLRDLWASSWLASLLAWKAVEKLVLEYGPGVMVSPPGRLNPFYASSVLGGWLQSIDGDKGREWLWPGLGFDASKKWPVDPVVPSRLLISLPGLECDRVSLQEKIARYIEEAWKSVLGRSIEELENLCNVIHGSRAAEECIILNKEVRKHVIELPPPLAVRVIVSDPLNWGLGGKKKKESNGPDVLCSLYIAMLERLRDREREIGINAPGRRTGKAYHRMAEEVYKNVRPSRLHCTMCGKGIAITQGVTDASEDKLLSVMSKNTGRLLAELGGERLCPYCLVKRSLRYILTSPPSGEQKVDLAEKLVGMKIKGSLRWRSLIEHTGRESFIRSLLNNEKYRSKIEKLADELASHENSLSLVRLWIAMGKPPVNPSPPECIKELLDKNKCGVPRGSGILWAIIVEALDNPRLVSQLDKLGIPSSVIEAFKEIVREFTAGYASSVPRRFAIIKADGDYMGRGLLSGKIPSVWVKDAGDKTIEPLPIEVYYDYNKTPILQKPDKNDLKEEVKAKVEEALNEFRDTISRSCSGIVEEDCLDDVNIGDCVPGGKADQLCGKPATLHVTPSYHMTVSRSLALTSFLDRESLSRLNADIVYLGGDDALVVSTPVTYKIDKNSGFVSASFPALDAVYALRLNWSGNLVESSVRKAFNVSIYHDKERDTIHVLHVAPAPGAYGRSISLFLSDLKNPLWLAISMAQDMEEAKDRSRVILAGSSGEKELWRKDILIMGSDTRGVIVLPQNIPGVASVEEGVLKAVKDLLYKILQKEMSGDEKKLLFSKSMLTDIPENYAPLSAIIHKIITTQNSSLKEDLVLEPIILGFSRNIKAKPKKEGKWESVANYLCSLAETVLGPGRQCEKVKKHLYNVMLELNTSSLEVNGVDLLKNNKYLSRASIQDKKNELVRIPLIIGLLGAAHVYDSAVWIGGDTRIDSSVYTGKGGGNI